MEPDVSSHRGALECRERTRPMRYAYIRVSTDKQSTETQRFEILKFADAHKLAIDQWIEETVSGTKKVQERKLGQLLPTLQAQDVLIVTEISRLGRSLK